MSQERWNWSTLTLRHTITKDSIYHGNVSKETTLAFYQHLWINDVTIIDRHTSENSSSILSLQQSKDMKSTPRQETWYKTNRHAATDISNITSDKGMFLRQIPHLYTWYSAPSRHTHTNALTYMARTKHRRTYLPYNSLHRVSGQYTVWVKKNPPPRGRDIFSFFSQTVENL